MVQPSDYRIVLSTRIDATCYEDACDRMQAWATEGASCYVIAANVHVVMTAYWSAAFRAVVNQAALVTPDGMPLVWALRLLGVRQQTRVYGPDLMLAWCDRAARFGIPLYLYGGTEETLCRLKFNLEQRFPGLMIAGYHSPPFRPLTLEEEAADRARIHESKAAIVFVGLGCPKQEEWMARQQGKLQAVMVGVGAAFSFHSGTVSQAPRWMMAWGLEWLYRFAMEPGRLWKRYLLHNPAFVALFGLQLLKHWMRRGRGSSSR